MPKQGMSVLREQTERFIDENPSWIVFNRNVKVSDGAGGTTVTTTQVPGQKVRVVTERRVTSVERRNVNGTMVSPDANIIAEWDADIQRGDTYSYQNMPMEVVWVTDMGYEKVAEVAVR